jgi:hypothetical protein
MANIRYIHGSEDSTDVDVFYVFDELPSFGECKAFCAESKEENRNVIAVKEGVVVDCFKGTIDEIQNALLRTYPLHQQEHPLILETPVTRDVLIKCIRALRCVLSHLSRTTFRSEVKSALKNNNWHDKLKALERLDIASITDFQKDTRENVYKIFAFQIGQTLALFDGVELYTKSEIAAHFPKLRPYLYRVSGVDQRDLMDYVNDFIIALKNLETHEENGLTTFVRFGKTIDLNNEKYVEVV